MLDGSRTSQTFQPDTANMTQPATLLLSPTQWGPKGALFANRWGPRRPRSAVSSYRIFMSAMFVVVVSLDTWLDSMDCAGIAGPASVVVWALTLMGSHGVGPVRAIWDAAHR